MARPTTRAVTMSAARTHVQKPMRLKGMKSAFSFPVRLMPAPFGRIALTATAIKNPAAQTRAIRNESWRVRSTIVTPFPLMTQLRMDWLRSFTEHGHNDTILKEHADVAQLVEQLIRNQQVVSSSLTVGSINNTPSLSNC